MEFPHLPGATEFPGDTVDAYRAATEFDYGRWSPATKVKLCRVPWDSSYTNVGAFETEAERDGFFSTIPGKEVELTAMMRILPEADIDVPLPFDAAQLYNYCYIQYIPATSADAPLDYEGGGLLRYGFFVDSASYNSPSSTKLHLSMDVWTTYRPYVTFSGGMVLTRGHYAVAQTSTAAYLANPQANSGWLLHPDDSFGDLGNVESAGEVVLNGGEVYAVICTYASLSGDWGSYAGENPITPGVVHATEDGVPSTAAFAMPADRFNDFIEHIDSQVPWAKQAILAVFFASSNLITIGTAYDFFGFSLNRVQGSQWKPTLIGPMDPSMFGYPSRYVGLAKLFTYPYSAIEISDDKGRTAMVRVEDTTGRLTLDIVLTVAFPHIGIDALMGGVGDSLARSITFANLSARNITVAGRWYDTLRHWDIPCYSITQSAYKTERYRGYYTRTQGIAAADTAQANANAAADTAKKNTTNTTAAQTSNTALSTAASSAITSNNNSASITITSRNNATAQAAQAYDAGLQRGVQEADATAMAATTISNSVANVATGVIGGLLSGGPAGAVANLVTGGINAASAGVNAAIAINASEEKVELTITNSQSKTTSQNTTNTENTSDTTTAQTYATNRSNTAATSSTANTVNAANTNATNNQITAKANAKRSRDNSVAAVQAAYDTVKLNPPNAFGASLGGSEGPNLPMAITANIITQEPGAIAEAGDCFLRYGYRCERMVYPSTLKCMPEFSYWQGRDITLFSSAACTDGTIRAIAGIIERGTTVWNEPGNIGKVGIYDNGI